MMADALLSMSIGPVQSFIAAARTTRDLWTGSYLLSWLTREGIRVASSGDPNRIVFPAVTGEDLRAKRSAKEDILEGSKFPQASFPNLFVAFVPVDAVEQLKSAVLEAIRQEWRNICKTVRDHLYDGMGISHIPTTSDSQGEWDYSWHLQLEHYFDIRCQVVRPTVGKDYAHQFGQSMRLLGASKVLRHVPASARSDDTRPQCSLLGTHSQMGPVDLSLAEHRDWWRAVAEKSARWKARIGQRDRLCAVSLVKRYAGATAFGLGKLPFPDAATVAAQSWLARAEKADPVHGRALAEASRKSGWDGEWLHGPASEPESDSKAERIDQVRKNLEGLRRTTKLGKPPTYYAVLMMDGDNMGEAAKSAAGNGPDEHRKLSAALGRFAKDLAPKSVSEHSGTLVYSGGDDVLALVATDSALAAAAALHGDFSVRMKDVIQKPGMSAGIVVAHIKADLRDVLEQARSAEKTAKNWRSTKDAVCLRVLKRSGEHGEAACGWDHLELVSKLVDLFIGDGKNPGVTDRWAYHLAGEVETLAGLDDRSNVVTTELGRLLKRAEMSEPLRDKVTKIVEALWRQDVDFGIAPEIDAPKTDEEKRIRFAKRLRDFAWLLRAASFLARGRDE